MVLFVKQQALLLETFLFVTITLISIEFQIEMLMLGLIPGKFIFIMTKKEKVYTEYCSCTFL